MDIQTLSDLFSRTLSADPNARKAAELEIRRVGRQEGMVSALLQIIQNEGLDAAARQASSVYLKNRVRRSYYLPPGSGDQPIFASDRQALKSHLIPLIISTQSRQIKTPVAQALRYVIAEDFPKNWPNLLDDTKRLLASSEIRQVETGLLVLLEIIRAFRFKQADTVTPQVISETFPIIVTIGTQLLNAPPPPLNAQSPEIPYFLHLILKIYKSTLVNTLSDHQQSNDSIIRWGGLIFAVVNIRIPLEAIPQDENEREASEWWKAKKWAYATLARLFHKFGSPSQLPSVLQQYVRFAEQFVTTFAPEIIKTYLQQLELYASGQVWISPKCQYLIFQFLTECVKPKSTWALLKDHFEQLISRSVFPMMCFNETKAEIWEHEPIDFIREATEEFEDYSSPVSSASTFVMMMARNRTKTTFLPIMNFINNVLGGNHPAPQRYGALSMVSLLASCMAKHPTVNPELETFLFNHVLREFEAPEKYMRYIACQVVGNLAKFTFPWSEASLFQHYRCLIGSFENTELPVRIAAIEALTILISKHESVKAATQPMVGKIVQEVLKLSDETDLDLLNHVMEAMVKHYTTELLPVAAELTARLCQLYMRLVQESVANQPEDDAEDIALDSLEDLAEDKVYSAMGMGKTILTIIQAMESSPDILIQLQEIIIPIVTFTLEHIVLDLLSTAYEIIDTLTFNLRRISPSMWPAYEITYKIFKADAVDFLEDMLPSLDNFITFGKDVFAQRPDYRAMAIDIYTTAMNSDHLGDNDRTNGAKVAESLLLNLPGHLDEALPSFITTALKYLTPAPHRRRYFHVNNLNVLINCVYYNPALALQILESHGATNQFFEEWFKVINSPEGMPRVHCKKLTIVTICRLFETSPAAIPASLQNAWLHIMLGLLKNLRDLPQALEVRKAEFDKHVDDDEDELDDYTVDDLNLEGDPEADVWDADSEYLDYLAKEGARLQAREAQGYESESDDDADEEWADDELGYISPLDALDAYKIFHHALSVLQISNPQAYSTATAGLDVEWQTVMMESVKKAGLE